MAVCVCVRGGIFVSKTRFNKKQNTILCTHSTCVLTQAWQLTAAPIWGFSMFCGSGPARVWQEAESEWKVSGVRQMLCSKDSGQDVGCHFMVLLRITVAGTCIANDLRSIRVFWHWVISISNGKWYILLWAVVQAEAWIIMRLIFSCCSTTSDPHPSNESFPSL